MDTDEIRRQKGIRQKILGFQPWTRFPPKKMRGV
jgi:hypothetical protein